jgi:hypothetical protein
MRLADDTWKRDRRVLAKAFGDRDSASRNILKMTSMDRCTRCIPGISGEVGAAGRSADRHAEGVLKPEKCGSP